MSWLICYVCCVYFFTQFLRLGQKRSYRTMAVVAVNYALAAALSAAAFAWADAWDARGREVLARLGAANGVLFFLHILVMMAAFRLVGVGITWAFVGSGVVLPVLAARFIWAEPMSSAQWMALALVPPAAVLLRPPKRPGAAPGAHRPGGAGRTGPAGDLVLFLCFLIAGAIGTLHKAQDAYAGGLPGSSAASGVVSAERLFYQTVLFGTTLVCSAGYLLAKRMRPTVGELRIGLGVGVANTMGLFFALLAIQAVAATVFFPTSSCLIIAGNTVMGRVIWRERLVTRQLGGLLLALAIVVLANMRA